MLATNDTAPPRAAAEDGFLGCGLRGHSLAAMLAASVLLFLFWGGPLWSAPEGSSHVLRIAISYLVIIPLAAGLLQRTRRLQRTHLISTVALLWSAKLVITASLYSVLTAGAADRYQPAAVTSAATSSPTAAPLGYRPATQPGAPRELSGFVRSRGKPIAGAAVFLEAPPPGLPLAAARDVRFAVGQPNRGETLLATLADRVVASNDGPELHTLRLTRDALPTANLPLPPGAQAVALAMGEPGIYAWSCAVHPHEGGAIVVLDHPYGARSDGAGHFVLAGVPEGDLHLAVARHGHAVQRLVAHVVGPTTEITFDSEEFE